MASDAEVTLFNPPSDGISAVKFSPRSNMLLAASWDRTLRLYDAAGNVMRGRLEHQAPVLDCTFGQEDDRSFSGGLDRAVVMHDWNTGTQLALGNHDDAVKCVEYSTTNSMVLSGGWDNTLRVWDHRAPTPLIATTQLADKVYTMDVNDSRAVVGCAGRHIYIFDLRNLSVPEEQRQSALKYQTRCIRAFPDGLGFAVASVEGRVSVDFFGSAPGRFAFKCHRVRTPDADLVYPVNALAFHRGYGTFATGGSDGFVNIWDRVNKKRIVQFPKYSTGVSSLSFSPDGSLLAIAVSYTFDEGEKQHPEDAIVVRRMQESDVRSK